ncbi:MAG: hypothetical protein SGI72_16830 [Planctomycetota bacterium]|nr:hypothetical protein [Planctomycetota bacterium]
MLALVALVFPVTGCSGGGSDDTTNSITSVVQDIGVDPNGATTVITFASDSGLGSLAAVHVESDGGQTATSVTVASNEATVVWNGRVTSADQVRIVANGSFFSTYAAVTPSSTTVPTIAITNGTQTAPLGGDSFDVEFTGPRVVEADVEDISNWDLKIGTTILDLTGTTIVFDVPTQTATVTLGSLANLHAAFSIKPTGVHAVTDITVANTFVVGTASGDAVVPTLLGAEQNLVEDEFGRVVDFQFSEAMDPVFSVSLSSFGVTSPDIAVTVTQPSDDMLRVVFNNPIVPGVNTVALSSLVDAHGNSFVDAPVAITAGSTVANAFSSVTASTSANTGGDTIVVVTSQAFDPDTAIDTSAWTFVVDSVTIDLTTQTFTYDLDTKTLTVALDFDMQNGDSVVITGVSVVDVDGQTFALTSSSVSASGDAGLPTISSVTQNRNVDVTGKTLIALFSEDLAETIAETTSNWSVSGTQNVTTATLLTGGDSVLLEFDAVVIPGDVTFGALNVTDLAGNAMTMITGVTIGTTDTTAPSPVTVVGYAIEGAFDDTISVVFDDDMIESEVETPANWTIESPIGISITTTGDPIVYNTSTKTAVLTLLNAGNLARGSSLSVAFANCRDIAGNTVTATAVTGTIVSETTLPVVRQIYRETVALDHMVVTFSEPVLNADDAYDVFTNPEGVRYILRTSVGALLGTPTSMVPSPGFLSVRLGFGFVVNSTDTLDVLGIVDMCGNPLFPEFAFPTVAEATTAPSLSTLSLTSLAGENNDFVSIQFDRPMNPFKLLDPTNYAVVGPATLDLANAQFRFDGDDTVIIGLRNFTGHDIATGGSYTITATNVWSAQGVKQTSVVAAPGNIAVGDSTSPTVAIGDVRIDPSTANALLVTASEALDITTAQNPAFYDYDSGNVPTAAARVGQSTLRLTFAVAPVIGQNLQLSITDLAGNVSGTITRAVAAADATDPLVASVAGLSVPNLGRDQIFITFDEQVDTDTALFPSNYTLTNGTRTFNPAATRVTYDSVTRTVVISLPSGSELDTSAVLNVTVQNVADFGGNVMGSLVSLNGAVTGDVVAPSFENAFVDLRVDATGRTIDVLFDEDVDSTWASNAAHWTVSGGPTVTSATMLSGKHARLVLTGALGASATVDLVNQPDLANNVVSTLSIDPIE